MNFLLFTVFVFLTAEIGYSVSTCQNKLQKFVQNHEACVKNGEEIIQYIGRLASDTMTYTELESVIGTTCSEIDWSKCADAILEPATPPCNETTRTQIRVNYYRMAFTFAEYLCPNNGSKYLDFARNDGAKCFDTHEEHSNCFKNGMSTIDKDYFNDDKICAYFEVHMMCSHLLDGCGNIHLYAIYSQILQALLVQFGC